MNFKNDIPFKPNYSKRNIKKIAIPLMVAIVLWAVGTYLVWNGNFPLVSLFVLGIILVRAVNGWKSYKIKQEEE